MAKTSKKKAPRRPVGRQAPADAWTPDQLASVFRDRSDAERVEALKLAGIIDQKGNITSLYKSWGDKITRTPDADS